MTGWLVRILISAVALTLRWRQEDPTGQFAAPTPHPMLIAFWHNRIFLLPHLYINRWKSRCPRRIAALVSASTDGDKLAAILEQYGVICVRGSSSRRGREALREMTRLVLDGNDAAITPDGPRGPKYVVQPGVISLAQLTRAPIVPVSYTLSRKIVVNSWDNFMIPLPFARCLVRVGAPIWVPREADEPMRESKRIEVETALQTLSAEERNS
jgi:lysophospholipid acyltransferase (LPLAT)-like uncharacterized protein